MLTKLELERLCDRLLITPEGRHQINHIRSTTRTRRLVAYYPLWGAGGKQRCVFWSRKMNRRYQFPIGESVLPVLWWLETVPGCLEYYVCPTMEIKSLNSPYQFQPEMLVVAQNRISYVNWLRGTLPVSHYYTSDEEHEETGISLITASAGDYITHKGFDCAQRLEHFLTTKRRLPSRRLMEKVMAHIVVRNKWSTRELRLMFPALTVDDIHAMAALGLYFVDLDFDPSAVYYPFDVNSYIFTHDYKSSPVFRRRGALLDDEDSYLDH